MKLIVLTGLPGCGKSLVLSYFKNKNVPCSSADDIVRDGYKPKNFIYDYLMRKFGEVDKKKIVNLLCTDSDFKKELETFTFSKVFNQIVEFTTINYNKPYVVAEIPLYFEACIKYNLFMNNVFTIGIRSCQNNRFNRVKSTRGWNDEYFSKLTSMHMNENEKLKLCDLVIENEGGKQELFARLDEIKKTIDFEFK